MIQVALKNIIAPDREEIERDRLLRFCRRSRRGSLFRAGLKSPSPKKAKKAQLRMRSGSFIVGERLTHSFHPHKVDLSFAKRAKGRSSCRKLSFAAKVSAIVALTPEKHLAKTHPRMAELIARARRFERNMAPLVRPFDALAESIAYQQLSGKAAATIWGRVKALYPRRKWLDPKLVLATSGRNVSRSGTFPFENARVERSRRENPGWHRPERTRARENER